MSAETIRRRMRRVERRALRMGLPSLADGLGALRRMAPLCGFASDPAGLERTAEESRAMARGEAPWGPLREPRGRRERRVCVTVAVLYERFAAALADLLDCYAIEPVTGYMWDFGCVGGCPEPEIAPDFYYVTGRAGACALCPACLAKVIREQGLHRMEATMGASPS